MGDPPRQQVPPELFAALAVGEGGEEAARVLTAAEIRKHLELLWGVVTESERISSPERDLAREGFDLLESALRHDSVAMELVRLPSVGAWARRAVLSCRGRHLTPAASPSGLRSIAAAAAIRAGLPAEIEVDAADGQVVLPSLGAAQVPGRTAVVRVGLSAARVGAVEVPSDPYADAPGWVGLRRIREGALDVLIDDLDPFRMPSAHDLAPRSSDHSWKSALREALSLLNAVHPVVAAEVTGMVRVIVPRTAPATGAVSSTAQESFGAVALSLPADAVAGAEAFAHEIQHLKLGALLDQIPLVLPDDGTRYYAPWREDPRPLGGLLQGAYAYLGVSGFWRRQRHQPGHQERGETEYARWREATAEAVRTLLSSGRLTDDGANFVTGMERTLHAWRREQVPAHAESRARELAASHRSRWEVAHGS